jgi:hypothetical protein
MKTLAGFLLANAGTKVAVQSIRSYDLNDHDIRQKNKVRLSCVHF